MILWVDIEASAGGRLGDGPILARDWEAVRRLDQAGTFKFSLPAADPKAALLAAKRVARGWTMIGSTQTEIGVGIIEDITVQVNNAGVAMLQVAGADLLRELTYRDVGSLAIGTAGTPPTTVTTGPASIIALAPPGWSLETDHALDGHSTSLKAVYYQFSGETVLQAFVKLAELTGEHFRLGTGRKVIWMQDHQNASGIRAVQSGDPIGLESNADVCVIQDLTEKADSYDLVTRITPYGAGEGAARITLAGSTWSAPAGYSISTAGNYIANTAAEAGTPGIRIDAVPQSWKDIKDADSLAAMAYEWLKRNSVVYKSYQITVAKLDRTLEVGSTIRATYQQTIDGYAAININANLVVLETTRTINDTGIRTTALQVATVDRWPASDTNVMVSALKQSTNFQSHAQPLNADDIVGLANNVLPEIGAVTGDPTGFTDSANVIVTYDPTTRKVTLTGTVAAYYKGTLVSALVSGWVSAAHANTTGHGYYLSYDGSTFSWATDTPWTFDKLQIAYVYFGASDKFGIRECHGLMPWQAHEEFHETIGTYRETGGVLASYVPASTTTGDRRPTVTATTIHDEDIVTVNAALTSDLYTQVYLTSTGTTTYAVDAAEIVPILAANPYYNLFSTPIWTQVLMANNSYMCIWLAAVPVTASAGSQKYRYLWVQGQSNGNLASQQALTPSDLNLGTLAAEATEFVFIAKIIIRYTGDNWAITSVTNLTGNRWTQIGSPVGAYLSSVAVDGTLTGDGLAATPLSVRGLSVAAGQTLTVSANAIVSGTNTGDLTLAANNGLSLTGQVLTLGTPNTLTATSTNNVSGSTHTHAITLGLGLVGNGSAQYQLPVTGATPFAPAWTTATGTGAPVLATSPTFVTGLTTPAINAAAGLAITPVGDLTINQNSVAVITSVASGAAVNTLYAKAGQIGIGTSGPSAKLSVAEATACGTTAGNYQVLEWTAGSCSTNAMYNPKYLKRQTDGSNFQSVRWHDSIRIDASYNTPGVDTKCWWERDPYSNIQAWGTAGATYLTLSAGSLLLGTATDGMTAGGSLAIAKDLAHRGTKAGFQGATPIAVPTAYTQTYSTASRTVPNATASNPPVGGTGATAGAYDTAAHRDAMITSLTNCIADVAALKQVVNSIIDDIQAYGLFQ